MWKLMQDPENLLCMLYNRYNNWEETTYTGKDRPPHYSNAVAACCAGDYCAILFKHKIIIRENNHRHGFTDYSFMI